MLCEFMPVKNSPSVSVKTDFSHIICKLSFTQKTEAEPFVKISYKIQPETDQHDIVKSVIEKTLVKRCSVTQLHFEYIELIKGIDSLSVYLKCFRMVAKIANLDVIDTLVSSTYIENGNIASMAYFKDQQKVINFYTSGPMTDIIKAYRKCLEEAIKI